MGKMKFSNVGYLTEYLVTNATQRIANAIVRDILQAGKKPSKGVEFELRHYLLGARARPGSMDVFILRIRKVREKKIFSYLVKSAHHFSEPSRSIRASKYGLGPEVIAVDKKKICERLLACNDTWRIKAPKVNIETAKCLGNCMARKFLLMIDINLIHQLDDFPEHTFILDSHQDTDIKWIDWGKQLSLDLAGPASEFLLQSHLAVILENLRTMKHAELAYLEFRKAIITKDVKGLQTKQVVQNTEKMLTNTEYKFFKRWRCFLDKVNTIVHTQ